MSFLLPLLWACAGPAPVLPAVDLPPDTLLLREWIVLEGPERSLGRRERFDRKGCWTMAANTWLWVHDPLLQRSPDPGLHHNGRFDPEPWFCLSDSALWRLQRALEALPTDAGQEQAGVLPAGTALALRWVAVVEGQPRVLVTPFGLRDARTAPLDDLLGSLAAEGAWGSSPEAHADAP